MEVVAYVGGGERIGVTQNDVIQLSPSIKQTISGLKLSDGKVVSTSSGKDVFVIPILSSKEFPLQFSMLDGGVGVTLGGRSLGLFPQTYNRISNCLSDSLIPEVNEDDTTTITIHISEHTHIVCELLGLSNEEIIAIREDPGSLSYYSSFIFDDEGPRQNNNRSFTPNSIVMELSDTLKETLGLLGNLDHTESRELSPSDELREVSIAALGDEDHKKMLDDNMRLKLQHEALMKIRSLLLKVDFSHNKGSFSFSLDEGEVEEYDVGHPKWCVNVDGKEMTSIALIDVLSISLTISGTQVQQDRRSPYVDRTAYTMLCKENGFPFGMKIPILYGVNVIGIFNWNAHSNDEIMSIADNFRARIHSSLMGGNLHRDGVPVPMLPPTFKVHLLQIEFAPNSLISHVLKMTGVGEELFSTVGGEAVSTK